MEAVPPSDILRTALLDLKVHRVEVVRVQTAEYSNWIPVHPFKAKFSQPSRELHLLKEHIRHATPDKIAS